MQSLRAQRFLRFPFPGLLPLLALLALAGVMAAAPAAADPTPQVTSEIHCDRDADCPRHSDPLCASAPLLPGCGCNEGTHRCDPNPKACDEADGCFRREVCSSDGRCIEPGPRAGTACNTDVDCPSWMSCLLGQCSTGECTRNADCRPGQTCERNQCTGCGRDSDCGGGFVCRTDRCVRVSCIGDDECGARETCREGACHPVECREDSDCRGCELCTAANTCVSRCEAGERCAALYSVDERPFTILHVCAQAERCAVNMPCPNHGFCAQGRCVSVGIDLQHLTLDEWMRRHASPPGPALPKPPGG